MQCGGGEIWAKSPLPQAIARLRAAGSVAIQTFAHAAVGSGMCSLHRICGQKFVIRAFGAVDLRARDGWDVPTWWRGDMRKGSGQLSRAARGACGAGYAPTLPPLAS